MVSKVLGDLSKSQNLPLKWLMIVHWNLLENKIKKILDLMV